MPLIKRKETSFPQTQPWEDFLDMSRWRVPARAILEKRLAENAVLFAGNYLWVAGALTVVWGLFLWRLLLAGFIVACGWKAAEVATQHNALGSTKLGTSSTKTQSLSPEAKASMSPTHRQHIQLILLSQLDFSDISYRFFLSGMALAFCIGRLLCLVYALASLDVIAGGHNHCLWPRPSASRRQRALLSEPSQGQSGRAAAAPLRRAI